MAAKTRWFHAAVRVPLLIHWCHDWEYLQRDVEPVMNLDKYTPYHLVHGGPQLIPQRNFVSTPHKIAIVTSDIVSSYLSPESCPGL